MNLKINKEACKELLDLKEAILVPVLAHKLSKYAKIIYYVGLVMVVLMLLCALWALLTGNVSVFILKLIGAFVTFVVIRMFAEFLMEHHKAKKAE